MPKVLNRIPKNPRLLIYATYHHAQITEKNFKLKLDSLDHYVEVHELGNPVLSGSKVLPLIDQPINDSGVFRVSPEGLIFLNCYDLCKYYV